MFSLNGMAGTKHIVLGSQQPIYPKQISLSFGQTSCRSLKNEMHKLVGKKNDRFAHTFKFTYSLSLTTYTYY
jgi:hypothetical protein